jgi:hypothetical protein
VGEDGLRSDADTVEGERISEDADYEGVRVTLVAYLERAKIPIHIDVGSDSDQLARRSARLHEGPQIRIAFQLLKKGRYIGVTNGRRNVQPIAAQSEVWLNVSDFPNTDGNCQTDTSSSGKK